MSIRTPSSRYRGIYSYEVTDGKRWGAVVDGDPDYQSGSRNQKRRQGFRTQDEARKWQMEFQDRRRRGESPEHSTMPLKQWMDEWLAGRSDMKPTTRRIYERHFSWFAPIGNVPLARLSIVDIERTLSGMVAKGHVASSAAKAKGSLSTCLRAAIRLGLIAGNPASDAQAPRGSRRKQTALTIDQVNKLLEATRDDGQWHLLWRFAFESCLRIGEFIELRWSDVDLDNATVSVTRNQSEAEVKGQYVVSTPKTESSIRTVAISPTLAEALRIHREQLGGIARSLVFPDENGNWLSRRRVQRALERACATSGVPRLNPHGLRHTGGSIAHVSRAADIVTISERMGHSDIMTTYRLYVHVDELHHRKTATAIGALFEAQTTAVETACDTNVTPLGGEEEKTLMVARV